MGALKFGYKYIDRRLSPEALWTLNLSFKNCTITMAIEYKGAEYPIQSNQTLRLYSWTRSCDPREANTLKLIQMDGNEEFNRILNDLQLNAIDLVAKTARWVHPDTFKMMPVWYPALYRGCQRYNREWTKQTFITKRTSGIKTKVTETNVYGQLALKACLGVSKGAWPNWTCCHIWGTDDESHQSVNPVVRDPRFYSCTANMMFLPTPLKALTDSMPRVKRAIRTCGYYLYDWTCELGNPDEIGEIRSGKIPDDYPDVWPTKHRDKLPPGVVEPPPKLARTIQKRKETISIRLKNKGYKFYPREQVRGVLDYWHINLEG